MKKAEILSITVARQMLEVFDKINRQIPPLIYTDLSPRNIIIEKGGRVRLVDASSLLKINPHETSAFATIAYLSPKYIEAMDKGKTNPFDITEILYGLGKLLYYILTKCEPLIGTDPDWKIPFFSHCDRTLSEFVVQLCNFSFKSFRDALHVSKKIEISLKKGVK